MAGDGRRDGWGSTEMKLCCAAIIANECDIAEAFVRHALTFADHLHIMFHNSYDTTQEIVARLIEEGLSISTEVAGNPAYRREQLGCELIRSAASRDRFDYMLPLDADEFIAAESRSVLETELAAMPADGALSLAWLSYVPTPDDDPIDPNPLTRIRHRLSAPHPLIRKVFFRADLMQRFEDVVLADGNHRLLSRQGRAMPERTAINVHLAHYPVRSTAQIVSKSVLGSLVRQVSPDFNGHQSGHWRGLMSDLAIAEDPTDEQLMQIAKSYLGEAADTPLIDAPLIAGAQPLRFAGLIRVQPFARLARCLVALNAAGALHPIATEQNLADGRLITLPEAEYQRLLTERDLARSLTQQLHREVATMAATVAEGRRPWRRERNRLLALAGLVIAALVTLLALRW